MLSVSTASAANTTVTEVDTGSYTYASVKVSLNTVPSKIVKVTYATKDGTATAGDDYVATSGTLVIKAGSSSGTIKVKVLGDDDSERTEKFYVRLTSAVHAYISKSAYYSAVKILDNDSDGGTTGSTTDIADNLSATSGGYETSTSSQYYAASFTTSSKSTTLNSVVLLYKKYRPGPRQSEFTLTAVIVLAHS